MSNKPRKHLTVWWAQLTGKPYVSFNGSKNLIKHVKKVELKQSSLSTTVADLLNSGITDKVVIEVTKKSGDAK